MFFRLYGRKFPWTAGLFQAELVGGQNVFFFLLFFLPCKTAAGGTEWNVRLGQMIVVSVEMWLAQSLRLSLKPLVLFKKKRKRSGINSN